MVGDRFDYSAALTRSWKEQMLMNMVKLRYMDPPTFLDVQQVVQQYTLEGTGAINAPGWTGDSSIIQSASAAGRWAESPTITYLPMSGEKFTKSLLRPVSPSKLFSLIESGWPVDAVFAVGVRAINGLHAGSQTALFRRSADPNFYRVTSLLRELQSSDSFGIRVEGETEGVAPIMVLQSHYVDEAMAAAGRQVRELLHLNPEAQELKLVFGTVQQNDKEIALLTRSMLEILSESAAGVEIPSQDLEEGRAVKSGIETTSPDLDHFFLVRVHSSASKPEAEAAFAAVHYRNTWFWVDDRDIPSKRGLSFLMILFTLVESGTSAVPPALTIGKP